MLLDGLVNLVSKSVVLNINWWLGQCMDRFFGKGYNVFVAFGGWLA